MVAFIPKEYMNMYIQKMTEQGENDSYIKCSRCRMKYHRNDDSIKQHFGYNRSNEQFTTCLVCREVKRYCNKAWATQHYEQNKGSILIEKGIQRNT